MNITKQVCYNIGTLSKHDIEKRYSVLIYYPHFGDKSLYKQCKSYGLMISNPKFRDTNKPKTRARAKRETISLR